MKSEETSQHFEPSGMAPNLAQGEKTVVMETGQDGFLIPGHPLEHSADGISLPGYSLLSVLGVGGMGTVFLARQENLNRLVAVKVIKPEYAFYPQFLRRMVNEGRTMAAMNHPNIVGCYDIVSTEDNLFLIMEYIPGRTTMRDLVLRLGPLPESFVIKVMIDVLSGLDYIHEKGFIHRDLKPDNLFLYRENRQAATSAEELLRESGTRIIIGDFGISHASDDMKDRDVKKVLGSPVYMSPEQYFIPEQVDFRTDIYSLACTAYFLLTNQPPFTQESTEELMEYKRQHSIPDPQGALPGVGEELCRLLKKMAAPHPDDRYGAYGELLEDLKRIQTHQDDVYRQTGRRDKNMAFFHGAMVMLLAIVLFMGGMGVRRVIIRRYFTPILISFAQSPYYWEIPPGNKWQRMSPDLLEKTAYLRGFASREPIKLTAMIGPGDALEFKARFLSGGMIRFGFEDEAAVEKMAVIWRYQNSKESMLSVVTPQYGAMYMGNLLHHDIWEWKTFRLEMTENQFIIYGDGKILGVVNSEERLPQCKFYLSMLSVRVMEMKDVFVIKKPREMQPEAK